MKSQFANDRDVLLSEVYAAELLGISTRTLQAWRTKGIGPNYVRVGRAVRYRRGDLLEYIASSTVLCKASAASPGGPLR